MKVTLSNFKNHKDESFELEGSTAIMGRNGSGKTSVLEAILFAYYGRDFYKSIAVDGFLSRDASQCSVVVDDGTMRIKRTFGENNTVALNGKTHKQSELYAKLPPMDLAYAILNPLYLLFEMSDLDIRSLFMDNMELPDPIEIFKQEYGDDPELVERYRTGDYENIRNQHKSMLNTIESLEKDIAVKEGELLANKSQMKQIEDNRISKPRGVLKKEEDRQREIDELNQKIGEYAAIESEIQSCKDKLQLIRRDLEKPLEEYGVETLSELIEYYRDTYDELSSEVEGLTSQNTFKAKMLKDLGLSGVCPLCSRELGEIDLREQLSKEIKINSGMIKDLEPKRQRAEEALETAVEMREEISEIKTQINTLQKRLSRRRNLERKIENLKSKQKGLSQEDFKNAVQAEAQTRMLKNLRDRNYRARNSIEENKESLKNTREELKSIEILKEALSPKGVSANQAKVVGRKIQEKLADYFEDRKVTVKTVRKNKTNENFREVFDIRIDGVHYLNLSFGERILVAVILGLLLRESAQPFLFNFVLLDEASVLSEGTLKKIVSRLHEEGVNVYYTQASNEDLNLVSITQ